MESVSSRHEKRHRDSDSSSSSRRHHHHSHHKKQKELVVSDQCAQDFSDEYELVEEGTLNHTEDVKTTTCQEIETLPPPIDSTKTQDCEEEPGKTPPPSLESEEEEKNESPRTQESESEEESGKTSFDPSTYPENENEETESKIPPPSGDEETKVETQKSEEEPEKTHPPPLPDTDELCKLVGDNDSDYHEEEEIRSTHRYGDLAWKQAFFGSIEDEYPTTKMRHICHECGVFKISKEWFYPLDKTGVYCSRCAHIKYGLNPNTEYSQELWKKYYTQYHH